jgi:hypothetical protein
MGTRPVASLHRRSVVESMVETTVTCATSFATEMRVAGLKTSTESGSTTSRNSTMKETMTITTPTTTNLSGIIL